MLYAMENIVQALLELAEHDLCHVADESAVAEELAAAALCSGRTFRDVWHTLRTERHDLRQRLNGKTYAAGKRAHPEVLWEFAEILSQTKAFRAQRVHLLVDEYDNLSELQQRVLNTYLRKRDFPVTFKVACRKHRLVTHDIYDRPLTESGDFTRVSLDDERLGLGKAFASYVEAIANKRLRNAGVAKNIREFLGKSQSGKPRAKGQRRYSAFTGGGRKGGNHALSTGYKAAVGCCVCSGVPAPRHNRGACVLVDVLHGRLLSGFREGLRRGVSREAPWTGSSEIPSFSHIAKPAAYCIT